jgi:hypothetical protein
MTFLHPLLLGGLLLAGIPILLHLIMRQKPKRLPFPALRFLLQRHRTNQRSMRLRHLLLLALRIFLIAAMCLALARPKLFAGLLHWDEGQPVAVVLLIDTSYSMQYTAGGRTRLDEAKARAEEILKDLPDDSVVAVLDSADSGGNRSPNVPQARQRVADLTLRYANYPLNTQLKRAFDLLNEMGGDSDEEGKSLPRFLYVFSDRTAACWNAADAAGQRVPEDVQAAFVDVGVKEPEDMAILKVEPVPPVVAAGNDIVLRVTVQAYGKEAKNKVTCRFDDETVLLTEEVDLPAGKAQELYFHRPTAESSGMGNALGPGLHQAEVRLSISDDLPFNNQGFVTFTVLQGRGVLIVADDLGDAKEWHKDLEVNPSFRPERMTTKDFEQLDLKERQSRYAVICLLDVEKPAPLWGKLGDFVRAGGGLIVIPGGEGWKPDLNAYANPDAQNLLPGKLEEKVVSIDALQKADSYWAELLPNSTVQNTFLEKFRAWRKLAGIDFYPADGSLPWASRYWQVTPTQGDVLVHYAKGDAPALLERTLGKGKVLLFTTAFDERGRGYHWNNYNEGISFYFVLANHATAYLAGDLRVEELNHACGQTIVVNLPESSRSPLYNLKGPGLGATQSNLPRAEEQDKLVISKDKTATPGNFSVSVSATDSKPLAAYSLNADPAESNLDKVPAEQIERVLGKGCIVPVGRDLNLKRQLQDHWGQPLVLAPWLLIALLLALAVENLLANKFYRREEKTDVPQVVT